MVQSGTQVQEMDAGAWESTAVEVSSPAEVTELEDHQPAGGPDRSAIAMMVKAAAAGDQHAWNGLVDKFASTVWAIARGYRLNAADAADVSQTTWLRLVENLNRIEQPERVGAWLATTTRREALRVLRLAGRQIPNGDDFEVLPDIARPGPPRRGTRPAGHRAGRPATGTVATPAATAQRGLAAELSRHQRSPVDADRQHRPHPGPGPRAAAPAGIARRFPTRRRLRLDHITLGPQRPRISPRLPVS